MRGPDGLYFSNDTRFRDLADASVGETVEAVQARLSDYFIVPARTLLEARHTFASGVIAVTLIDALAEFSGTTYDMWLEECLVGFKKPDLRRPPKTIATSFKEDFRNGLVHHARLNRGAEFTLDSDTLIEIHSGAMIVNPRILLSEVEKAAAKWVALTRDDPNRARYLRGEIHRIFRQDIEADRCWSLEP